MRLIQTRGDDTASADAGRALGPMIAFWIVAAIGCWLLFVALAGPKRPGGTQRARVPAPGQSIWGPPSRQAPAKGP